jgi:hypothetical protein
MMPESSEVNYRTAHRRVCKAHGQASYYHCVKCGRVAEQWALLHFMYGPCFRDDQGLYSLDTRDYIPLCRSCHKWFDSTFAPVKRVVTTSTDLERRNALQGVVKILVRLTQSGALVMMEAWLCERTGTPANPTNTRA